MSTMIKKILCMLLAMVMVFGTTSNIKANESIENLEDLSSIDIYEMNDDEFINMVMSYVNNSDKSFEEIQSDLLSIGVEIEKKKITLVLDLFLVM